MDRKSRSQKGLADGRGGALSGLSLTPYFVAMRTTTSNEMALKQYSSEDGKRVLSIIPSGNLFRFVVEQLTHEPATSDVGAYEYWEETHRSGLYETADVAEQEALAAITWVGQKGPNDR